jgi:hypothetical protein
MGGALLRSHPPVAIEGRRAVRPRAGWPRSSPEPYRDPHSLDRSDGVPDLHHAPEPRIPARPHDLPAPLRQPEPHIRGPARGDVGDGGGEPDASARPGRTILPEPQGTGPDEDIDAGIARLGRALNRVALDGDAAIEPDASHPRILIGGCRRGWGWRWWRRLKLEGTDVTARTTVGITIARPWLTALVTSVDGGCVRTHGSYAPVDGPAACDQRDRLGRATVVTKPARIEPRASVARGGAVDQPAAYAIVQVPATVADGAAIQRKTIAGRVRSNERIAKRHRTLSLGGDPAA